jgi:Holliday junction resolvasome RuvABC endonuclease subunit
MIILGIDGALKTTGWAVIEAQDGAGWEGVKQVNHGKIEIDHDSSLSVRLFNLRKEITSLIKKYKPDQIVIEDTYSGINALTNARLNNVKGVLLVTALELLGKEPICVTAATARTCLEFKNGKKAKERVYKFFKAKYDIKESFKEANDITDAYTLTWFGLKVLWGECKIKIKKPKAKSKKAKKKVDKPDKPKKTTRLKKEKPEKVKPKKVAHD